MSLIKSLLFLYGCTLLFLIVRGQTASGIDENCLGCICEGSTNCNASTPCFNEGSYYCGAFLISYLFWTDAGKPVLGDDDPERRGAFEACTLDLQCAALTVRRYMEKFTQDCNGDGRVTCADYMRIHKNGGYGCKEALEHTDYFRYFDQCATALNLD